MLIEIILCFIMSYPSLYGSTYIEEANNGSIGVEFVTNDLLLALMIICRLHFVVRAFI